MGTHSSVFSFLIPSHSLSFFCLTPFWVNHLTREAREGNQVRSDSDRVPGGKLYVAQQCCTYMRYWSLVLRSWMRSGLMLFILLSISL